MDSILDRLADLLKSLLGDGGNSASRARGEPNKPRFADPDLTQAWEELDEYMSRGGDGSASEGRRSTGTGRQGEGPRATRRAPADSLRQDYANLEVPFGVDIEEVKKSYRGLMLRYHPDKHAGNAESQRIALEITKKINESFERIRTFSDGKTRAS